MKKLNLFVKIILIAAVICNVVEIVNYILKYQIYTYSVIENPAMLPNTVLNIALALFNATAFILMLNKKAWGYYLLVANCVIAFIASCIISPHDWLVNIIIAPVVVIMASLLLLIRKDGYNGYQVIGVCRCNATCDNEK